MSDQPKPTTSEDDIHSIVACVPHDQAAKIIAFHNAALAAERDRFAFEHTAAEAWRLEVEGLREQLAAEREAREVAERSAKAWEQDASRYASNAEHWQRRFDKKEEQLAAEREKVENLQRQLDDFGYLMRTHE